MIKSLGDIQYVVWSDVFVCNNCGNELTYFDNGIDWKIILHLSNLVAQNVIIF